MLRLRWLGVLWGFALAGVVHANDNDQIIRQALLAMQPDLPIEKITVSPMPNLYQVQLKGGRLLYASADGEFLLQGNLFQLQNGQATNLTEQFEQKAIATQINNIPMEEMVVFAAKEAKTHITVFTDTDCGYCQKLHSEVAELTKLGVEVRYLAFPRQGVGSHGYNTLTSIWCADDPVDAMNEAKARRSVPNKTCKNPVDKQYALGQAVGVQGTPTIILANGKMIPGYQPAQQLATQALKAQQ
jgi:thiol:disulfide interchange protein DsbC